MPSKVFVGNQAQSLTEGDHLAAYTKVTVTDGNDSYSSGDDTGRELVVTVPVLPTAKGATLAANILAAVSGYQYQPYEAAGALLDPAAELGDGITVGGVYGGVHAKTTTFSRLFQSDVAAPAAEEVNEEYPYLSAQERDAVRQKKQTAQNTADIAANTSDIADNAGNIATNANAITQINADIANFGNVYAKKATVDNLSAKVANIGKLFTGETYTGSVSTPSLYVNGAQYVGTVIRYVNENGATASMRVLAAT